MGQLTVPIASSIILTLLPCDYLRDGLQTLVRDRYPLILEIHKLGHTFQRRASWFCFLVLVFTYLGRSSHVSPTISLSFLLNCFLLEYSPLHS